MKIDPLQVEIEELAESIFAIKSSQEYIVARERRHRDSKWMIKKKRINDTHQSHVSC